MDREGGSDAGEIVAAPSWSQVEKVLQALLSHHVVTRALAVAPKMRGVNHARLSFPTETQTSALIAGDLNQILKAR